MIIGTGVDICQVERVAASLRRFGERFVRRILTAEELSDWQALAEGGRARFLARRFAAKEAALKALGTGARLGIALCDVGVDHDELGRPLLVLHGLALRRMQSLGVARCHLSISDERDYAIAFVLMESSA